MRLFRDILLATGALVLTACSGEDDDGRGSGSHGSGISETGTDSASASGGDSGGNRFDVGEGSGDGQTGGDNMDDGCKKVDVLFVVDDSQSFEDEQVNLINSFPGFVQTMRDRLGTTDSFHVGVTTSDAYSCTPAPCNVPGALVTQTCGSFSSNATCGPYSSGSTYMTEIDPLETMFACAAQVGTSGDINEQPMFTLQEAINPTINAAGGCNEGFIRDDALLVVVILTDEEDDHETACNMTPGSPGEPPDWFATVVGHKSGIETNIVVLSLIGPDAPNACPVRMCGVPMGAELATRIIQFTEMFTYGFIGQVCAPSYDAFFDQAVDVIKSACDDFQPPG